MSRGWGWLLQCTCRRCAPPAGFCFAASRCSRLPAPLRLPAPCSVPPAGGELPRHISAEVEALKREWSRHEAIMRAIADPSMPGQWLGGLGGLLWSAGCRGRRCLVPRCRPSLNPTHRPPSSSATTAESAIAKHASDRIATRPTEGKPDRTTFPAPTPSTESVIAKNAFDRITAICDQLGLRPGVVEIGHQAAEILLMMRPPAEAPSDFQEYTLVGGRGGAGC